MNETEVQFRVLCDRCEGAGRVPPQRFAGGAVTVPGETGELCPKCRGAKVEQQGWLTLSDLGRLLETGGQSGPN